MDRFDNLNIQYAIIDITLGGTLTLDNKVIKLTGIDILEVLLKNNPKLKYILYTGNQMNTYIKPIKLIIDQYKKLTGEDIEKHILHND